MFEQWELQRVGILRQPDCFQVISPSGGLYEMDRCSIGLLLQMHGKLIESGIDDFAFKDIEKFSKFAEGEFLLMRKLLTDYIEPPFNIQQVRNNLDDNNIEMLTLGDLSLQITNNCNYQCKGCSVDAYFRETTKLVDVDFEQVIKDAARFGCLTLGLTGGEPILPGIINEVCHLIEVARSHNFQKVVIATNGFYIKQFISQFKKAGATRLSISFHGFDGYMESYTGCPQASTKSQEAISSCLEEGLHLGINCVITKQNLFQMDRIVEEFYSVIANIPHAYIRFSPLIEVGRASRCNEYLLTSDNVTLLLEKITHYKKLYNRKIRLTCDEEYEPDDPLICDAGLMYAFVNKDGSVSPCDILEAYWVMSKIERESFFEIWNDNVRWHDFRCVVPINQLCASCPIRRSRVCFGRCKVLAYLRFGSVLMTDVLDERRCLK